MKAIVGSPGSKTPVFQDEIEYLVFNPSWRIPIRKSVRDIIPIIKKRPRLSGEKKISGFLMAGMKVPGNCGQKRLTGIIMI